MRRVALLWAVMACGAFVGCSMPGGSRPTAEVGPSFDLGSSEVGTATISAGDSGADYQQYAAYRQQLPAGETQRIAQRPIGTQISYPSYYDQPAAGCSSGC